MKSCYCIHLQNFEDCFIVRLFQRSVKNCTLTNFPTRTTGENGQKNFLNLHRKKIIKFLNVNSHSLLIN